MSTLRNLKKLFKHLPPGWLTFDETRLLWHTTEDTTGPILEVGSYYGRSTVLLAHTGRVIYAVDPFSDFDTGDPGGDKIEAGFLENTKRFNNIFLFRQKIEDWKTRKVGFAYLDGDHTYQGTKNQIEVALACHAEVIAIHDVNDTGGGTEVKRAALEYFPKGWERRVGRLAVFRVLTESN